MVLDYARIMCAKVISPKSYNSGPPRGLVRGASLGRSDSNLLQPGGGKWRLVKQTSLKWWGVDEANHFASYSLSTQIVCDAFDGIDSSELRTSPVEDL